MNRTIKRLALPLGAAAILGTSGFAYMASNTVGTTYAGQGSGPISGYTLLDYHYNVTGTQNVQGKTSIASVDITLDHGAHNATLYITDSNGNLHDYGCQGTNPASGGGPWTQFVCSEPGAAYSGTNPTAAFFSQVLTSEASTLSIEANY